MTNEEIRQAINEKYELQTKLLEFDNFALQIAMFEIKRDILRLQAQCQHKFNNGRCEYCDKMEE